MCAARGRRGRQVEGSDSVDPKLKENIREKLDLNKEYSTGLFWNLGKGSGPTPYSGTEARVPELFRKEQRGQSCSIKSFPRKDHGVFYTVFIFDVKMIQEVGSQMDG